MLSLDVDQGLLDAIARFEEAWAMGHSPDPQEFAQHYPALSPHLLRELIVIDFNCRWESGQGIPVEVHLNRFPAGLQHDTEILLDLISAEMLQVPSEPDERKYRDRFPELERDIQQLFHVYRHLGRASFRNWLVSARHVCRAALSKTLPPATGPLIPPIPEHTADEGGLLQLSESYELHELIGQGGSKDVRRALQVSTRRPVAVKQLREGAVPEDVSGSLFVSEGRTQARLDHQNIPPIFALGPHPDAPTVLVEKLVPGRKWSETLPGRSLEDNLRILLEVSKALAYAHRQHQLIHRDIKPDNVMVGDEYGEVYLVDWGLALHVGEHADPDCPAPHRNQNTHPGGTLAYLAPEVASGRIDLCSPATDVFLLGGVLYHILTGTPPYHRGPRAVLALAVHAAIEPPEARAPAKQFPAELGRIAMKALSLEQADRYADAGEFADALQGYLRHAASAAQCARARFSLEAVRRDLAQRRSGQQPSHPLITRLIEVADEFRQARAEAEAGTGGAEEGSRQALQGEGEARQELVELALQTGDFVLAEAQLDLIAALPDTKPEQVDAARAQVRKAAARRRRQRRIVWGATTTAVALALLCLLLFGYVQWQGWRRAEAEKRATQAEMARKEEEGQRREAERERQLAEKDRLQAQREKRQAQREQRWEKARAELEKARAEASPWQEKAVLARAGAFQQGEAMFLMTALGHTDRPDLRVKWMEAMQRSLVPVATSSRRVPVGCLAYSPDGTFLVSGDVVGEGAIRVWNLRDLKQSRVLFGHPEPRNVAAFSTVRRIVFHPGRPREIISAGLDGTIRRWDLDRGEELAKHPSKVSSASPQVTALDVAAMPEDGKRCLILTGDSTGKLVWRDLDSFRTIAEQSGHTRQVNAVRFHPGGRQCASAGADGEVRLWDHNGKAIARLRAPGRKPGIVPATPNDLAYSPDGKLLAVGCQDGLIYIWDVQTRKLLRPLAGHEPGPDGRNWIIRLTFAPSGQLFSTGTDGTVREWDVQQGRLVAIRGRHDIDVHGHRIASPVAIRPDGKEMASAGWDCTIRLWDLKSGKLLARLEGCAQRQLYGCIETAFCPDRDLLITTGVSRDAFLRSWDTATLRERRTFRDERQFEEGDTSAWPGPLAVHPGGKWFVVGVANGDLEFWETQTGKLLASVRKAHPFPLFAHIGPKFGVAGLAWSHNGKRLASLGADGRVKLWEFAPGLESSRLPLLSPALVGLAARSPVTDSLLAAAAFLAPQPLLLRQWQLPGTPVFTSVFLFDRDDRHVITAGSDGLLCLRDAETGKVVERLPGHTQMVSPVRLSNDGALLASAQSDGLFIVWDWKKRRPSRTVFLPALMDGSRFGGFVLPDQPMLKRRMQSRCRRISGLAFSPDRRLLAVAQADGTVTLIDLQTGVPLHRGYGYRTPHPMIADVNVFFTRRGHLMTVSSDGCISRWDLLPWPDKDRFTREWAHQIAAWPKGKEWAAITGSRQVVRWSSVTGQELSRWPLHVAWANVLTYNPSDGNLIIGTLRGKGIVLDRHTGKVLATFQRPRQAEAADLIEGDLGISALAVDPTGKWAATNRADYRVDLWNTSDGTLVKRLSCSGKKVVALAFRPKGSRQLATLDQDGQLTLWNLNTYRECFPPLQGPHPSGKTVILAYPPDGRRLVHAGHGGEIAVWNPDSGRRVQTLMGHRHAALSLDEEWACTMGVAFSPDGRWLATCGTDGTVRLWDATGRDDYRPAGVLSTLRIASYRRRFPGSGELGCLAFSGNGRLIASTYAEPPIRVFDLYEVTAYLRKPPEQLLRETERRTGLYLKDGQLVPIERNRLVRVGPGP